MLIQRNTQRYVRNIVEDNRKSNGHKAARVPQNTPPIFSDTEPLLGLILDQLKDVVDYSSAAILALTGTDFSILALRGPAPQEKMLGRQFKLDTLKIRQEVVWHQKPLIISDVWDGSPTAQALLNASDEQIKGIFSNVRSFLGIPLKMNDDLVGVLVLLHSQCGYYTTRHAEQAVKFARQVTSALENDCLYQQVRNLATLEERARLARELHDELAQALGFINIKATLISELLEQERVAEAQANLKELKEIARDTYTDVRDEIFNLRTTVSSEDEFIPKLSEYLEKYQQHHQETIDLLISGLAASRIPVEVGNQIIRIIQEALNNVRKHAQASTVTIRIITKSTRQIIIRVEDDGRGFDLKKLKEGDNARFGLQIMRERAESVGGRLLIDTAPGQGTRLEVVLP